ncbi:MAG: YkgJ family cysteine cluster protein [Thermoguttaceae bacterium]
MTNSKKKREDLAAGEVLCMYCAAKCCRYFALPIDKPETWQEFDFARWFLLHDRATVFVDDDDPTWHLLVHTTCKHLRSDNLCGIYETRPQICRDYTTDKCEYEDMWVYDQYFELPEQIEEYGEAVLGPRPGQTLRTKKP